MVLFYTTKKRDMESESGGVRSFEKCKINENHVVNCDGILSDVEVWVRC